MAESKNWFDRTPSVLSLIVTAFVGILASRISNSQYDSEKSHTQFTVINDMLQKCTSDSASDTQYFSTLYAGIRDKAIVIADIDPALADHDQ
jgi:hypothetical protein